MRLHPPTFTLSCQAPFTFTNPSTAGNLAPSRQARQEEGGIGLDVLGGLGVLARTISYMLVSVID